MGRWEIGLSAARRFGAGRHRHDVATHLLDVADRAMYTVEHRSRV